MFWLWVIAGCAASALFGFSAMRFGARKLLTRDAEPTPVASPQPRPPQPLPPVVASVPAVRERPARTLPRQRPPSQRQRQAPAARATPAPAPTAPQPEAATLALWTRQVKEGERKMSLATDGCRVTWNRTCKHGHPTWLVYLGYLKRQPSPKRHNPR